MNEHGTSSDPTAGKSRDHFGRAIVHNFVDAYICPHCLLEFLPTEQQSMVEHSFKCNSFYDEGLTVSPLNALQNKEYFRNSVARLRSFMRRELGRDHTYKPHKHRLTWGLDGEVFLYVVNGDPVGMFATEVWQIPTDPNATYFCPGELVPTTVVTDFMVVLYMRGTGVSKKIFDLVLEYYDTTPDKLTYQRPTIYLTKFLKKWYGLKEIMYSDRTVRPMYCNPF